jgi:hypothetical protein
MSLGVTRRLVAAGSHLGFQRGIRRSLILNELGVISPNWGRFSGLRARAPLPPQGGSQAGQPSAEIAQDWPSRSARGDDDASGVARRRLRVRGRRDSLGRSSWLVRDALDRGDSTCRCVEGPPYHPNAADRMAAIAELVLASLTAPN